MQISETAFQLCHYRTSTNRQLSSRQSRQEVDDYRIGGTSHCPIRSGTRVWYVTLNVAFLTTLHSSKSLRLIFHRLLLTLLQRPASAHASACGSRIRIVYTCGLMECCGMCGIQAEMCGMCMHARITDRGDSRGMHSHLNLRTSKEAQR